jgi:hypothetical protein
MSRAAEKGSQNVRMDRFHQMFIAARLFGQAAMRFLPIPAQCDDHQIRAFGLASHPTSQFKAIHIGQADIEKNDVRIEGAQHLERNCSVLCDADRVAVPRENYFQSLSDIAVILDQKNTPARLPDRFLRHVHRRPRDERQSNRELTSLARSLARRFDYAAVQLRQVSHQGQSEAEAPCGGFRRPSIELRIEIEDAFDSILRDSDSVIVNSDANVLVRAFRRNRDFTAFERVLRRVVQEVRQ